MQEVLEAEMDEGGLNEEIRRRTCVVLIFPKHRDAAPVRTLAVETNENGWRQPLDQHGRSA
ncbi:MAG: hypothetical protein E5V74_06155 [Mesorhizobium sp.]|nr:hypothetical protein EN759_02815 [Mesorhizobium sp. M00.F.Ca.ET.038.03.1.1]RWD88067.1 MAG: hypothetical protein EOS39_24040 [Mesorhizobium sp.]TIV04508.1 MAG: hypothetical protein E5W04_03280 [Mesorhizobium sp.]TIW04644.1 MAG: hypothetical protein E5V74_06155 [Mesorhizobium sp.]